MDILEMTYDDWMAEGKRRFGEDLAKWKFVCPVCGHIAAVEDFKPHSAAGATPNSATCECIGRYVHGSKAFGPDGKVVGPCDYAGYGLFRLSPVRVSSAPGTTGEYVRHCFAFAEEVARA